MYRCARYLAAIPTTRCYQGISQFSNRRVVRSPHIAHNTHTRTRPECHPCRLSIQQRSRLDTKFVSLSEAVVLSTAAHCTHPGRLLFAIEALFISRH